MVSTRPFISKSSSPCTNPLVTVPTASLLKSPGLFSVFWPILIMLYFEWSPRVLLSLYQSFGNCTESTNYNWFRHHFHVPQLFFFQFPGKVQVPLFLFCFFQFYCGPQSPQFGKFFSFFVDYFSVWSSGRNWVIRIAIIIIIDNNNNNNNVMHFYMRWVRSTASYLSIYHR